MHQLLCEAGIEADTQGSNNVEIDNALKTASKHQTGKAGYPEYVAVVQDLIDEQKVIDDLGNEIAFPETIFKLCFESLGEAVTAYCPMAMDYAVYSIFLILHNTLLSLDEIKAYAEITNRNYLQARKALINKKNLLVSGDAYDIRKILEKLNAFQVQYEIEPPYPYIELIRQQTPGLDMKLLGGGKIEIKDCQGCSRQLLD